MHLCSAPSSQSIDVINSRIQMLYRAAVLSVLLTSACCEGCRLINNAFWNLR